MRTIKFKLVILLGLVSILGCEKKQQMEEPNDKGLFRNEININPTYIDKIKNVDDFFELLKLNRITDLETNNKSLIGNIEDIIYLQSEKKIIILDNSVAKNIFVFDLDGRFLNTIGHRGEAEGEYIVPKCIAYENGELAVFTDASKLIFYKLDGTFIKEISFPKRGWYFQPSKIFLNNNDLYCYSNDLYLSEAPDGKNHIVIKIKNCEEFENGFGELEKVFFADGGLMAYSNSILFSALFDGNIYEIGPNWKKEKIFSSIGKLHDVEKILSSKDQVDYIIKHIKDDDFDSILFMNEINNIIFLVRYKLISAIDNKGNVIKRDIPFSINFPKGYGENASRLPFHFYDDGVILSSINVNEITDTLTPNPSLLFYKMNDNLAK